MIVVVDASAAAKLVLQEQGSDVARRLWDAEPAWLSPALLLPEVAAAITAARRAGRLTPALADRAHRSWLEISEEISLHAVTTGLAHEARTLAASTVIRGADSVYLALAKGLAPQPVALLTYDRRQRAAAAHVDGLALVPADLATA